MKSTLILLALATVARADFSVDQIPSTPDILTRLIAGAQQSGQPLQSYAPPGENYVYYLRRAEYIGECPAPFGTVHIAQLFYTRSSPGGRSTPPPRGHTFLVFYDANFKVRGYWSDAHERYSIEGTKLLREGHVIFDYATVRAGKESETTSSFPQPPIWK